jgi:hypothetical protein
MFSCTTSVGRAPVLQRSVSRARSAQFSSGAARLLPRQDGELMAQDQDLCGLPCLLTPGEPQPHNPPCGQEEAAAAAYPRNDSSQLTGNGIARPGHGNLLLVSLSIMMRILLPCRTAPWAVRGLPRPAIKPTWRDTGSRTLPGTCGDRLCAAATSKAGRDYPPPVTKS